MGRLEELRKKYKGKEERDEEWITSNTYMRLFCCFVVVEMKWKEERKVKEGIIDIEKVMNRSKLKSENKEFSFEKNCWYSSVE